MLQELYIVLEISLELFAEFRLAFFASDTVDIDLEILQADPIEELDVHDNHLSIKKGIIGAKDLDPGLMKLPLSSGLGPLIAEHGADIIQFSQLIGTDQTILQTCPDHGSGLFRAKGQAPSLAVLELIHFLFNDIGGISDGAGKKFGGFKDRGADLPVIVKLKYPAAGRLRGSFLPPTLPFR